MTPARFQVLIEGAVDAWSAECALEFSSAPIGCTIHRKGIQDRVAIVYERQPFGAVWRITETGRRDRVHPSVVAALRGLREIIGPARAGGRVLFVQGDGA